ncbi:MAG: hypothetical protein LBU32_00285 [Clostridiales bacterium]|jgi:hypothetical protein|nr:hypothetical protein [Clostridiales bacterium]
MPKKKTVLCVISVIFAFLLTAVGTFMFFSDTADIATNVIAFAGPQAMIVMQETGWADRNDNNISDYREDGFDKDADGDNYWEFTVPEADSDPINLGYQDINTSSEAIDDPRGTGNEIPPFNGIEYPISLIPCQEIQKAPRVVHISGADMYLRVLAKLNIYQWSNADSEWKGPMSEEEIRALSNMHFSIQLDVNQPTTAIPILSATAVETLFDAYLSKDYKGDGFRWLTFGDYLQALFSDGGGIDFNRYNWERVADGDNIATWYYYYINSDSNEAIMSGEDLTRLSLPKYDDFNLGTGENNVPLAVFGGDNFATAPIFTHVTIPNITSAMREILRNYKISISFEAQAVQVENNVIPDTGIWADYFKEIDPEITKPNVNGNYYQHDIPQDRYIDTPGGDYPFPVGTLAQAP